MTVEKAIHPSTIRARVVREFYQSNFRLDPKVYKNTQNEVMDVGREVYDQIVGYAGTRNWNYFLRKSPLRHPKEVFIRVAGYGYLLTEFFIAPIHSTEDNHALYCEMGCLTNMIVSVYDHALDNRLGTSKNLLSRDLLEKLLRGESVAEPKFPFRIKSQISKVLVGLIRRYVELLQQLTVNKQLSYELVNGIYAMYEAEIATISHKTLDERKLQIKSSFPFILMGLIPWLSVHDNDTALYRWHKTWLADIGALFGIIDDVVDLKADLVNGHPNQLIHSINLQTDDETEINKLAKDIIQKCVSIKEQWNSKLEDKKVKKSITNVFATCVYSWLGN